MPDVELLHDGAAELAEGPVWIPELTAIAWADILAGAVWITQLSGATHLHHRHDKPVGAIVPTDDGRLVAATPTGLETLSTPTVCIAALPEFDPALRMNDGKPDPVGRFVGGTMGYPTPIAAAGSLWSFDGSEVRRLLSGVTISNGLCWSTDGSTLYYVDTPTQRIDAFDYDLATGDISERRTIVEIPVEVGAPDGLSIDDQGGLWVALWGGGRVQRYQDGILTHEVAVPTPYVTCPVFAGPDLDVLVITTAAEPFGNQRPSGAGALFVAEPGVHGLPGHRFERHRR